MGKIIKLDEVTPTGRYEPGLRHRFGLTTESCGATGGCLVRATIPVGHASRAHYHINAETFNFVLSGKLRVIIGPPGMELIDEVCGPNTFIYWARGEIHKVINVGDVPVELVGGYSCGSGEASGKIYVEPPLDQPDAV
jgi:uncharacterized RmlC-like cupin family protein